MQRLVFLCLHVYLARLNLLQVVDILLEVVEFVLIMHQHLAPMLVLAVLARDWYAAHRCLHTVGIEITAVCKAYKILVILQTLLEQRQSLVEVGNAMSPLIIEHIFAGHNLVCK